MKAFSIVWLVTMIVAATIVQGDAEQKTVVGVKFVLDEHSYRKHFLPDIPLLEREATARIVKKLREHIGFLDFAAIPPEPPFKLTVRLDAKAPPEQPGAAREVGFHIILDGPKVTRNTEYVIFRDEENFGKSLGTAESLVTEIGSKLRDDVYKDRIGKLLNQVPITRTGHLWGSPPEGWVIPYRPIDLCMDFQSQLVIENLVPSGAVRKHREFEARAIGEFLPSAPTSIDHLRGHIFSEPTDLQKFQTEVGAVSPAQISVSAVYVKEYRHLVPCSTDFR
ncbi:MAG TPA: hypothetical protein VJO34_12580 [Methylomirabilota bacterium]|nr:hypothetical protein [Methylomirabilota bacterium]